MAINVPWLRKTLEHMHTHPEEVEQCVWIDQDPQCGTTACMAGTAALLAGGVPWRNPEDDTLDSFSKVMVNGIVRDVERFAAELLGLTDAQAHVLFLDTVMFDGEQAVAVLYAVAETLTHGEIETPPDLLHVLAAMREEHDLDRIVSRCLTRARNFRDTPEGSMVHVLLERADVIADPAPTG